jgi:hypothetical protein
MRLGVLGPANGNLRSLALAAHHLLDVEHADTVVYLASDDALDRVTKRWAQRIGGDDVLAGSLHHRAAERCVDATPEAIDAFVAIERSRARLARFVRLPDSPARALELVDGRAILLVHDKGVLDEDEIATAAVVVFGKSDVPVLTQLGGRTFLSTGPVDALEGGLALLDDEAGAIQIRMFDATGRLTSSTMSTTVSQVKVRRGD